jgi:hypothetical protein
MLLFLSPFYNSFHSPSLAEKAIERKAPLLRPAHLYYLILSQLTSGVNAFWYTLGGRFAYASCCTLYQALEDTRAGDGLAVATTTRKRYNTSPCWPKPPGTSAHWRKWPPGLTPEAKIG